MVHSLPLVSVLHLDLLSCSVYLLGAPRRTFGGRNSDQLPAEMMFPRRPMRHQQSLPRLHMVVMSPPSMTKSEPVTLPARPLATSMMRSATSSGLVDRPITASAAACLAISPASPPLARATVTAAPSSPSIAGWRPVLD